MLEMNYEKSDGQTESAMKECYRDSWRAAETDRNHQEQKEEVGGTQHQT